MDKVTKNVLFMVFIAIGAITWYTSSVALNNLASYLQFMERYSWAHMAVNITPIVLGTLAAFVLYRVEKIRGYFLEVVTEIKKVVWPPKKETWGATVVVIIAVLISGVVLGMFDWMWGFLLKLILR